MASILIYPNEEFEHVHMVDSYAMRLRGEAILTINGQQFQMKLNEKIPTPANVHHAVKNIGKTECEVGCGHQRPPHK